MTVRALRAAAWWPGGARLALALALLTTGGLGGQARAEEKASLPGIEKEFKEAIRKVTPATVVCLAKGARRDQNGSSGVIVSKKGLVLSDSDASRVFRVVGEGNDRKRDDFWVDDVEVRVPDAGTFKAYAAKVVKRVAEADTMLLRITSPPPGGFPVTVTIGSSDDLQVGDFSFAVGNSFDLSSEALPSLTAGVVSSLVPFPAGHAEGRWQTVYTSAGVNPGVNGGPLVDIEGRLIGTISTWGDAEHPDDPYQFLGKVIPVQRLRRLYGDLPEAAELFPEAKPVKLRSAQSAALESTFHAAAQAAYPSVASLVIERSSPWKPQWMVPPSKKVALAHFEGPTSAVAVSARGELVTSLYNLTNVFSLPHSPGPGQVVDADLALESGLATITRITACLPDGRTYPARIVGIDPRLGVALLRAEIPGGDSALPVLAPALPEAFREGRFALALGNPFGAKPLASPLLTVGILSKVHSWYAPAAWRGNWQTDAAVTDANCGGALVGLKGELFGMLQIWDPLQHGRASGIGFVVPWTLINEALPALRAGKVWKRGRLGVQSSLDRSPPVLEEVLPGSAAARAGLKAGDAILAIDGRKPRDGADAIQTLRYRWAGEHVRLTIERAGEKKPLEIDVVLDERPEGVGVVPPAPSGPPITPGGGTPPDKPEPVPGQPPAPTPDTPK
jgi:S1-C subfamily serine protease